MTTFFSAPCAGSSLVCEGGDVGDRRRSSNSNSHAGPFSAVDTDAVLRLLGDLPYGVVSLPMAWRLFAILYTVCVVVVVVGMDLTSCFQWSTK